MSDSNDELTGGGTTGETILQRLLEDEMRESFIDYSMSVIVQRALPDVRDGLKPVHRRILYAMNELGLTPGRAYKKSATVVGDVLGKYHPHGDSAVYDSMVRMAQDFSLRHPLVDGQGNFGSIDGDSAAAYRYTEARLTRLATGLLQDIEKETVDFSPNFDGRIMEPRVLPSRAPNLLINGSSGIAVGMATNIPPHNLREIVEACLALIDDPDLPQEQLEQIVTGPDFPTGGIVCGREGIRDAYRTGRGRIVMRAKAEIEEDPSGGERIIVNELPFMVNKARLITSIADLVRDKKITDIRDLRDESDRDGMRVVVELKRDAIPHIVLNQLYKHTQMQSTFGTILLALHDGEPKVMSLREMLLHFIDHRHVVVVRRSEFDLNKAKDREHILEGLQIAVDNIDEVIKLIRASRDSDEASTGLQERFGLSERQAKAILDMRLARLTGLEMEKLETELAEVRATIAELEEILGSRERRMQIIGDELREVEEMHGDDRRTEITDIGSTSFDMKDLIPDEEMVITITRQGYVKRLAVDTYRAQRRGGRGLRGMTTKDEDWVEHLFVASAHDTLMIFTRQGQCYWLEVWQIPEGSRQSRGKPIVNLLNIGKSEDIAQVVPIREFDDEHYLFFATRLGRVKRTVLSAYGNIRSVGLNAININEGDELIDVRVTDGTGEVFLATRDGKAIRFLEEDAREMGRATAGVGGIRLQKGDEVVGMVPVRLDEGANLLVVTEKGIGKRTNFAEYRTQGRYGQGILNIRLTERSGKVVAIRGVHDDEQLMFITRNGVVNRQRVAEIGTWGRVTQGVRLVNLDKGDVVMDMARFVDEDEEEQLDADGNPIVIAEESDDDVYDGADESADGSDVDGDPPEDDEGVTAAPQSATDHARRVGLDDVRAAAARIAGQVVRTPLVSAPEIAAATGAVEVRLKCENMQRAGAFKARGGLNYLSLLPPEVLAHGVTTYSSGNHAQAVALAARLKGVRAVVVMPTTAPTVKVEGARRLGAEVVFEGTTSLERKARCEAIAEAEHLHVVPPFDHPAIIAGQGTAALEIVEEFPEVDTVLAPIGGGGLFAGTCVTIRALRPEARLVGVEPVGGASMTAALDRGEVVTLDSTASIADGLLPVRAGELTFEHIRDLAGEVVTVDDEAIREATRRLFTDHHTVVEFSGGATTAALLSGAVNVTGRRVAVILSGGNMDPSLLQALVESPVAEAAST